VKSDSLDELKSFVQAVNGVNLDLLGQQQLILNLNSQLYEHSLHRSREPTGFLDKHLTKTSVEHHLLTKAQTQYAFASVFQQSLAELRYQKKTAATKLVHHFGQRGPYRLLQKKKAKAGGEILVLQATLT
jgi:hypothetical protein